MKSNYYLLPLLTGIMTIALSSCQPNSSRQELTLIEDISYSPQTQTTLMTLKHTGGCSNNEYQYEYQVINSDADEELLSVGLFVDVEPECKGQVRQFIRMPLPQTIFQPENLVFKSSGNKEIILALAAPDQLPLPKLDLPAELTTLAIEDANYNPQTEKVTLRIFANNSCGDADDYDYQIIDSDEGEKKLILALTTKNKAECSLGNYTSVEMPLPQKPFQPKRIVFPISNSEKIVLRM